MAITQNFCFEDQGRLFLCYWWVPLSSNTLTHTTNTHSQAHSPFLLQGHFVCIFQKLIFGPGTFWKLPLLVLRQVPNEKNTSNKSLWSAKRHSSVMDGSKGASLLGFICRLERRSNRQKEDKCLETSHHLCYWTRQSLVVWLCVAVSARHTPIDTFTLFSGL